MGEFLQIFTFIVKHTFRAVYLLDEFVFWESENAIGMASRFTMLDLAIGMNAIYILFWFAFGVRSGDISSEEIKKPKKKKFGGYFMN